MKNIDQRGFSPTLVLIGVFIVVAISGGAYYLGTQKVEPVVRTDTSTIKPESSLKASPSPASLPAAKNNCSDGFRQFSNEYFSLCYPADMTSTFEEFVNTNGANGVKAIFTNEEESILVQSDFIGGWGGGNCIVTEKTTVSGFPAELVTWKEEFPDGSCGEIYTSFVTIIEIGSERQPYYIGLSNKDGKLPKKYTPAFYSSIQQSFKINKL